VADREHVLALLAELQETDAGKGAILDDLEHLYEEVRAVQATADQLQSFQSRLPAERQSAARALADARGDLKAARELLTDAEQAVRMAKKDTERDAELFEVRARDRLSVRERRAVGAQAAVDDLERAARDAETRALALEAKARSLADDLRTRPRVAEDAGSVPEQGLVGISKWAKGARAALFVAQGQVTAEREAVIRQANELGSAALAEPLGSVSVAVVKRRVQSALG
jgi:chromosome segregation ATPase